MKLNRREFLNKTSIVVGGVAGGISLPDFDLLSDQDKKDGFIREIIKKGKFLPKPSPAQLEWQDQEIGLIYHFDISVALGKYEINNNAYREIFDPKKFNPRKLDTDQWLEAAK